MKLVKQTNNKKWRSVICGFLFQKMEKWEARNENFKILEKNHIKSSEWVYRAETRLTVYRSLYIFGRACERKIYPKMYVVNQKMIRKSIAIHSKKCSSYNKASIGAITCPGWAFKWRAASGLSFSENDILRGEKWKSRKTIKFTKIQLI